MNMLGAPKYTVNISPRLALARPLLVKELRPKRCNRVPLILLHKLVNPFIFNT
jgi:hypothetical protein